MEPISYTSNITVERKNSMNGCCLILKSPLRLAHRWRIRWNARLLFKVSLTLYYSKKSHEREQIMLEARHAVEALEAAICGRHADGKKNDKEPEEKISSCD